MQKQPDCPRRSEITESGGHGALGTDRPPWDIFSEGVLRFVRTPLGLADTSSLIRQYPVCLPVGGGAPLVARGAPAVHQGSPIVRTIIALIS